MYDEGKICGLGWRGLFVHVAGSDGSVIYARTSASNLKNLLSISRPTHDYYCSDPLFENAFNSKMNLPTSKHTLFLNQETLQQEERIAGMRKSGVWKKGRVLGKRSPGHVVRINKQEKEKK